MKRLVLRGLAVGLLVALVVGGWLGYVQATGPHYRVVAVLDVTGGLRSAELGVPVLDAALGRPEGVTLETLARTHAARMTSEATLAEALARPGVRDTDWFDGFEGDRVAALDDLGGRVRVRPVRGTTLLEAELVAGDAAEAGRLMEAWLAAYETGLATERLAQLSALEALWIGERDRAKEELAIARADWERWLENAQTGEPAPSAETLAGLRQSVAEARVAVEAARVAGNGNGDSTSVRLGRARLKAWEDAEAEAAAAYRAQAERRARERLEREAIERALERCRARVEAADSALDALRAWRGMEATAIEVVHEPGAARRVWWRWPWW